MGERSAKSGEMVSGRRR